MYPVVFYYKDSFQYIIQMHNTASALFYIKPTNLHNG